MSLETQIEKTEQLIGHARALREEFHHDPSRPIYHFLPPWSWMNDINGAIFWQGRYHIFYQHNPDGGYWKWMQWGHASSVDLVHWVHHPIALTPTLDGPDRDGCFSGGAFVNKEGIPTFIYHGVPDGTCIATSEDDLLRHWTKHPANPVIRVPKPNDPGYGQYVVYDPCAWVEGDTYYALIGNRVPGMSGDGTSLFASPDLVDWTYVGPFYRSDRRWTEADEDCAVPDFFPLGNKHMLLFCSHLQGTQYYLGQLTGGGYVPELHGWMSWPGGQLGGPRALLDGTGRRIFFDWIRELRGVDRERASGWSGVMTLPRTLSLSEDGTLRIDPVPELNVLRMNPRSRRDVRLTADSELILEEVQGECLELAMEIHPEDSRACGVRVRCSPDGAERTAVVYDTSARTLNVDLSQSTLDPGIRYHYYRNLNALERLPEEARTVQAQAAPFALADGEALQLRLFLDRSVLEVFANGRQCITQRIYPTRPDSVGVRLFSRGGGIHVRSIEAWDMAPTHD
ncbi:MAG: glycoside hydrolase family 32 protein [Candidatus Latescibacteria bacterium]|nr:glycoside hydrolase family 32 protein [Candidatus Latescibacterota bacterium]